MQLILVLIFVLLVTAAMIEDARRFRIPNWVSVGIVATFCVRAVTEPGLPVGWHTALAAVVFVIFFACYLMRWFGAGDVKFLASISLWAGPQDLHLHFGVMALTGLVLGVVVMAARRSAGSGHAVLAPWPQSIARWAEAGVCPYGIAIGCGALAVAFRTLI